MKKIIILASERSGTNLLRTLLGNHSYIEAPVAPHFFDSFRYSIDKYGDLSIENNIDKLLEHMLRLANHKYHDWNLDMSVEDLKKTYTINSLATAFDALYTAKAKKEGKLHYACKDNHMFDHIDLCQEYDQENVFYIYLYRDVRDHVASWLRTPLFMHTPFAISNKWAAEQKKILSLEQKYKIKLIHVKYEDLINDPKAIMTQTLEQLGVEVDSLCFETDASNKESQRNEFWKNLSKPIDSDNQKKYLKYLNQKDLKVVESVSSAMMDTLSYNKDTKANWKIISKKLFNRSEKRRAIQSELKHKELKEKTMADLQDKLELVKSFEKEFYD